MEYTAFYIIRSKPALRGKLQKTDYADLELVIGPLLWTNEQGGRTCFTEEDYIVAVKQLYVTYVKNIILRPGESGVFFGDLVDAAGDALFDEWWTLEVFQGFDSTIA